jgi:hypothetical protein
VFGADFDLIPYGETKSELLAILKKETGKLFPIRIAFSLDKAGPYKG